MTEGERERGRERGREGELHRAFFFLWLFRKVQREIPWAELEVCWCWLGVYKHHIPRALCALRLYEWQSDKKGTLHRLMILSLETARLPVYYSVTSLVLVWVAYFHCYLLSIPPTFIWVHLDVFMRKDIKINLKVGYPKCDLWAHFISECRVHGNTIEPLSNDGAADKNILFSFWRVSFFF